jgi:hypothetical protein
MQATRWTQGGHWHGQQQEAYAPQSYAMPPASSRAVLPASSYDVPLASSYAMPPASSKAVTAASSYDRPPALSYDRPPASSKAVPPAARTATPTAAVSQSYAPQSHASPSAGSHEHEAPPQLHMDEQEPEGGDIDAYAALWFAAMDRWVRRDGEEIVCPQIFATCFQSASDDALKTWYLGMPSVIRTLITTKPGCWNLFKKFLLMRFLIGDGLRLRRLAAEEVRELRPGVPCATFAIWKIYYMQCADPHLAPGAAIAMVKRELGWEAAAFCREQENIDDFISELIEFDKQQLEREFDDHEDAVARWFAEVDRMVLQDGEEIVCPKVFANSFQSDDGFKVWCSGMPSVVTTMITTQPGCWNRFKSLFSKWFFADVSPGIADFICELTEFDDQQQLEQQEYPNDVVINDSNQPSGEKAVPPDDPDMEMPELEAITDDNVLVDAQLDADHCHDVISALSEEPLVLDKHPAVAREIMATVLPSTNAQNVPTAVGLDTLQGFGSHFYHPQYGERSERADTTKLPEPGGDATTLTTAGGDSDDRNSGGGDAQKHQEKTTTDEPEHPDESVDDSISELIEFDEQKLEQQEYPDVVVDDSEHPMVLDENQAVATTSMTTVDTRTVEKSLRLDWQDSVRPASPRTSHGTAVGTEPAGTIGSHLYHPRTASGALNALHLRKEVIKALTLWFASDRCYEDELRDGIG